MKTHSHQVWPATRAEVSSEQITGLAITLARIVAVAASNGLRARASRLLSALADRQRKHLAQQQRQPFQADGMRIMQIHHQRRDRLPERRAWLQASRRRRRHPLAATRAFAAE
jgi:hypothetical protein